MILSWVESVLSSRPASRNSTPWNQHVHRESNGFRILIDKTDLTTCYPNVEHAEAGTTLQLSLDSGAKSLRLSRQDSIARQDKHMMLT